MRSQTIIAAAIAIAVCLVSGALVYAAGKDGGTEVKRVVRGGQDEREGLEGEAHAGIMKTCSAEVSVGPETSCELGFAALEQAKGESASIVSVTDPQSGRELSLQCKSGGASAAVICSGENATVYLASR